MRSPGFLVLTVACLLATNYAWGSNAACSPISSSSYTQVTSYGSGYSAGCYQNDQTFSNFAEAGGGQNQALANVYLAGGESGYTDGSGSYAVSATFAASASGAAWTRSSSDTGGLSESFTFVVDSANTYGFDAAYPANSPGSLISSVTLAAAGNGGAAHVQVSETICINATSPCNGNATDYVDLDGYLDGSSFIGVCNAGSKAAVICPNTAPTVTFTSPVTSLAIVVTYEIDKPTSGTLDLDDFSDTFGEVGAPEPSTFIFLGSALAGPAALRRCKPSESRIL